MPAGSTAEVSVISGIHPQRLEKVSSTWLSFRSIFRRVSAQCAALKRWSRGEPQQYQNITDWPAKWMWKIPARRYRSSETALKWTWEHFLQYFNTKRIYTFILKNPSTWKIPSALVTTCQETILQLLGLSLIAEKGVLQESRVNNPSTKWGCFAFFRRNNKGRKKKYLRRRGGVLESNNRCHFKQNSKE